MKIMTALVCTAAALALVPAAQAQTAATGQTAEPEKEVVAPEKLESMLVNGATVVTADNQPLGTITSVDGERVVMDLSEYTERPISFQREHFTLNAEGKLASVFTSKQITEGVG